jgi:hypothetical protein
MSRFSNIDPFARKMLLGALAFAAVMLLMFGVLTVVYVHANPRCNEQVLAEAGSPDGHWMAALMERRCGENVSPVTHLNLRPAHAPLTLGYFTGVATEGQVFLIPLDAREASAVLEWKAADELIIRCAGCGGNSPSQKEPGWNGVKIHYLPQ